MKGKPNGITEGEIREIGSVRVRVSLDEITRVVYRNLYQDKDFMSQCTKVNVFILLRYLEYNKKRYCDKRRSNMSRNTRSHTIKDQRYI